MHGNEHKVCKLVKYLYGLKQEPKKWNQNFDDDILSIGFVLNQFGKFVYSKFDTTGPSVIICLYVDHMLIIGTNQDQVDDTKRLLSSNFSMKNIWEANVILGIRIKWMNKGIVITQSHYIEKILNMFNFGDFSPVSTPIDPNVKMMPNISKPISQLEYSKVIMSLMYVMTSSISNIAYVVRRLSRYSSNPSTQHWMQFKEYSIISKEL